MADRFPLIANTSANQIQELSASDNLNLTGNSIIGVSTIGVGTITASNFVKADGGAVGGLVGSNNEELFVEAENAMDNDFTTTAGKNYITATPLTMNATLTVTSGSSVSFV